MSLPKINTPIFELILPSTEKPIKYRPFLVKEQKILLIAMESGDERSMMTAIKQIINNCAVDQVDVDKLPVFDLEYFFIRLRAKSIGETIDLNLRHPNSINSKDEVCEHVTKATLNLLRQTKNQNTYQTMRKARLKVHLRFSKVSPFNLQLALTKNKSKFQD